MDEKPKKRKNEEILDEGGEKRQKFIKFTILKDLLSRQMLEAIEKMKLEDVTRIQLYSIPAILRNQDVIGFAKTGSGKTLAYLIPTVEKLLKYKPTVKNDLFALILAPTRELAVQICLVFEQLTKNLSAINHSPENNVLSHMKITGGTNLKSEVKTLKQGVNVIVATPGRLLHHLRTTQHFNYSKLKILVIDEIDRMLDTGFEKDLKDILKFLNNKNRQTLMFSATKSDKIEKMQQLALKTKPVVIDVNKDSKSATLEGVIQFYTICPTDQRISFLYYVLRKTKNKKCMVFFSSTAEVEFYYKFFNSDLFGKKFTLMRIHGQNKQTTRTASFLEFCNTNRGTIFCTDIAARGLDIPDVDYILQFDPPRTDSDYIHRVGRTARGTGKTGSSLLVLQPHEKNFVEFLREKRIPLDEYEIPWESVEKGLVNIHAVLEVELNKTKSDVIVLANEAFRGFLRGYKPKGKKFFDGTKMRFEDVVKGFGFKEPLRNFKNWFKCYMNY